MVVSQLGTLSTGHPFWVTPLPPWPALIPPKRTPSLVSSTNVIPVDVWGREICIFQSEITRLCVCFLAHLHVFPSPLAQAHFTFALLVGKMGNELGMKGSCNN